MNKRTQIIRNAQYQMYKNPMNEKVINYIMRDLYNLLKEDEKDATAQVTLGKIFFEKKDYKKALIHFNIAHRHNPELTSAVYGIYKSSVMLGDYENASIFLENYKEKTNSTIDLPKNILKTILNEDTPKLIDTKRIFNIEIEDEELQATYNQLIKAYQTGDYDSAILLAEECEIICRTKKIYIEFITISKLLNTVQDIYLVNRAQNEIKLYYLLKEALLNDEEYKVIVLLNRLDKKSIKDQITFYNAIRYLIRKEKIAEVRQAIMAVPLYTDRLETQLLLKDCELKEQVISYDEETKRMFDECMIDGKEYIFYNEIENAYDTFLKGYYLTESPLFLYYMGKCLYKAERYEDAEEILLEYIKYSGVKTAKAYVYLRNISRVLYKTKKMKKYTIKANEIMKIFYPDFDIVPVHKRKHEDIDHLKMQMQSKRSREFEDIFNIDEMILAKK